MSVLNEDQLLGAPPSGQYQIQRSLRFNSADSAYLSRTPASAGNRKTWTWSGWVKNTCSTTTANPATLLFSRNGGGTGVGEYFWLAISNSFTANGHQLAAGDGVVNYLVSTAFHRDPSAWYHIVCAYDSTQTTAASRLRLYVNGAEVTAFNTDSRTSITQNSDGVVNRSTVEHRMGLHVSAYSDCYLADIHFIDGQALTPSSFGQTDATTGEWVPIAYTGTYGTNGFKLNFSNNSAATATTLGADSSGNGNNWTPNNLSVTAGAGNDSLVDTPTSYGTDTGVGGEVRGNYCTLNPLDQFGTNTLSNGNLDVTLGTDGPYNLACGTVAITSGKWYWEVVAPTMTAGTMIGISRSTVPASSRKYGDSNSRYYSQNGNKWSSASGVAYGASYSANDVVGVALDMDAGSLTYYKNGTSQGVAFTGLTGEWYPTVNNLGSGLTQAFVVNFGQRPFAYTAPSGFKALCDTNLAAPTIVKPSTVMDVKLYTGTGAAQTISGMAFESDLIWIKDRVAGSYGHQLADSLRGITTSQLVSNSTAAETAFSNQITATSGTGFTLGTSVLTNTTGNAYVAWCWDAGSSTVTNTAGTISSQVRANASAGFSVVTFTMGSGSNTVGHGLNAVPGLVISKARNTTGNWWVFMDPTLGSDKHLALQATSAVSTLARGTSTSSLLAVDNNFFSNTFNYVAYCFAPVAGYSAFGSYTGNGSATDGPFVYCGFRPRWVMVKCSSTGGVGYDWVILDAARSSYNEAKLELYPNDSAAEGANGGPLDITSNGFKVRTTRSVLNTSSATYIYCAFAEFPFQYARAR